jgi:uncharacterized cupin superfamily protein
MTDRRHPNLVNLDEVDGRTLEKGTRFGCTMKSLGRTTGAQGIGCSWYEQAPGRTAFPRHYHTANEESLYVLEGAGTVRIGEKSIELRAGDYVTFKVGPEHAHQITNTGDAPLRYLCFSTLISPEIVSYPDSNKVGAMAMAPGTTLGDPPWIRGIFSADQQVDYYDGEDTD